MLNPLKEIKSVKLQSRRQKLYYKQYHKHQTTNSLLQESKKSNRLEIETNNLI